ncbi:uncharacterized protein TRIADDRAFT_30088, partial [Trichoplax adhaerens]
VVAPTVQQIQNDVLTEYAIKYWAPHSSEKAPYDPEIIEKIYKEEMLGSKFSIRRMVLLEFSQYLENYLWPHYDPQKASISHIISITVMINEKFRERVQLWEFLRNRPENFQALFRQIMNLTTDDWEKITIKEQTVLLLFLIHCFNSMESDIIRREIQGLVSIAIWTCLLPGRVEQEVQHNPKYKKRLKSIQKTYSKADEETQLVYERQFLWKSMHKFLDILAKIPETGPISADLVQYCERYLEFIIDIETALPTRRFFNTLLDSCGFVVNCQLSTLIQREEGRLFAQLLEILKFYAAFEINDHAGTALSYHDITDAHYDKITALQRMVFKHFPELRDLALNNVASIDTRDSIMKYLSELPRENIHQLASCLNLVPKPEKDDEQYSKKYLIELLIYKYERRLSQLDAINDMPLYPTEEILWDENIVPSEYYSGADCLALPKLNLQFLTLHDYLLRNFNLFRLESTYEIRGDIEDAVSRMKPWLTEDNMTQFSGWARMAQPIVAFTIIEVIKPNIGESRPARVRADVSVNLNVRKEFKREWEGLKKHDVMFLVTIRATIGPGQKFDKMKPFKTQYGIEYVRGCEIEGMLDEQGKVIEEGGFEPKPEFKSDGRTFRVWLDTNQYQQDIANTVHGAEDVYETFNLLVRRKPKENNFKAVLDTIRDLMNTSCVVPDWLHDVFLGYGNPAAANYASMPNQVATLDFNDTFLTSDHLCNSFPNYKIRWSTEDCAKRVPPFSQGKKRKADTEDTNDSNEISVEPYVIENRGPYPSSQPKRNCVPFTPVQVEAIRSGMQPGLTLVVGPPGTGKTDVAVQIISNLYHNFQDQRTLIVTHSNQALNQLFEKIIALDIDERHLLRLGHGEESLETERDFSRYGRVNYILERRLQLLHEVAKLQESIGIHGDVSYSCETAGHFFHYQVLSRWEEYVNRIGSVKVSIAICDFLLADFFPFTKFFEDAEQPLFAGKSYSEDLDVAEGCFRHIKKIFTELEEFRAFELLRNGVDRSNYLLIKEARIVAMTCTHAALKRHDLVKLGFKYDNVLMEEAGQILEIETFIPLMLQNPEDGQSRLKRVTLIGDHHQLPPVIKNMAFQKFSNMEQPLFTRFVKLGVPTVDLDAQGRARASLCKLYSWRYKRLENLSHTAAWPEFQLSNPGFQFDYQLIDVGDFQGTGESEPNPHFFQNLAEAEYVVATYMYMRLIGYPKESISILTTYNGQKHLIRDVINMRCANNPLIGKPHKVTTVDRFQGQQNDYILLSLVRTKAVGHLRDVRRLVVAMSRARLGLYVFARVSLFQNCYELSPAFNVLMQRPTKLHLLPKENWHNFTRKVDKDSDHESVIIDDMTQMAHYVYQIYDAHTDVIKVG